MAKITKRFVESISPDPDKTLIFWDSEQKGFGVVVLPSEEGPIAFNIGTQFMLKND